MNLNVRVHLSVQIVDRPFYLDKLLRFKDKSVIKVITGVRRCGKSTMLAMFAKYLLNLGIDEAQIQTYNLERLENEELLDYRRLYMRCVEGLVPGKKNYLFIDEIQNVADFQKAVDSLYVRDDVDLYITGSNAFLLSGNLATLLSGRYVEIRMTPFSFAEYRAAREDTGESLQRTWSSYIAEGGMPATLQLSDDPSSRFDYLDGIISTILLKDVAQRLNIANTLALSSLVTFMFDNIANLTSVKAIADAMTAQGVKLSPNTVAEYLSGLCNSYFLYPVKRFDVRGKRLLKISEKYYGVDMGIRRVLLSAQVRDVGRILENVVFFELVRRYTSVSVGKVNDQEIDFICTSEYGRAYYQVAQSVQDPSTLEREISALRATGDDYPKFLLTLDDAEPLSHNGVTQLNALDWLMGLSV